MYSGEKIAVDYIIKRISRYLSEPAITSIDPCGFQSPAGGKKSKHDPSERRFVDRIARSFAGAVIGVLRDLFLEIATLSGVDKRDEGGREARPALDCARISENLRARKERLGWSRVF